MARSSAATLIEGAFRGRKPPNFLLEGRIEFLIKRFQTQGISTEHDPLGKHKDPEAIVNHFAQKADPSTNKAYTEKIMNWYAKGHIRQEDHRRIHSALTAFDAQKNRFPVEQRNIANYKTPQDLERAVGKLKPEKEKVPWASTEKEQASVRRGSTKILDTPTFTARTVRTHPAMKALGSGTRWCVVPSMRYFKQYKNEGDLIHIHDKVHDERFLFHKESRQFMDRADHRVDVPDFMGKHPDAFKIPGMAYHAGMTLEAHDLAKHGDNMDYLHGMSGNTRLKPEYAREAVTRHLLNKDEPTENFPIRMLERVGKEENSGEFNRTTLGPTAWRHTLIAAPAEAASTNLLSRVYHKHKDKDNPVSSAIVGRMAGSESTPADVLHEIAEKHFKFHQSISGHPNASPETLAHIERRHRVVRSSDISGGYGGYGPTSHVYNNLINNKNTSSETTDRIWNKLHAAHKDPANANIKYSIRRLKTQLANHPNLSDRVRNIMMRSVNDDTANAALSNPKTTSADVTNLAHTITPTNRYKRVLRHSNAQGRYDYDKRQYIESRPGNQEAIRVMYDRVMRDPGDLSARQLTHDFASRDTTPNDVLAKIVQHPDTQYETYNRIQRHENASEETKSLAGNKMLAHPEHARVQAQQQAQERADAARLARRRRRRGY